MYYYFSVQRRAVSYKHPLQLNNCCSVTVHRTKYMEDVLLKGHSFILRDIIIPISRRLVTKHYLLSVVINELKVFAPLNIHFVESMNSLAVVQFVSRLTIQLHSVIFY